MRFTKLAAGYAKSVFVSSWERRGPGLEGASDPAAGE